MSMRAYMFQLFLELIFLTPKQTAVNLDLLLTFTTLLYATFLTRQVRPLPGQARQIILDLGQLNLQASFSCAGTLTKNDQNQRCAIKHLGFYFSLQVTMLSGCQLDIK